MIRGNELLRDHGDQLGSHPFVRSAHNILLGFQEVMRKMIPWKPIINQQNNMSFSTSC
jgi:hypothetical protein